MILTPTFAAIALTTPLMLFGVLLVSLPIIAHLLNRKAKRRLVFPNIELLKASSASQSALFRLRRWILLIIRTLAVLLLVAAFARPLWSNDPVIAATGDQGSAVVLVVDRSLSVSGSTGSVTGLEAIRAVSDQVMAELTSGIESANVVYADALSKSALPSMTSNLNVIRQELEQLELTEHRADFNSAIAEAGTILRQQAEGKNAQLVVLSDLQETNWEDVDFTSVSGTLPPETKITVLPFSAAMGENVGISEPSYEPAIPTTATPVAIRSRLTNYSDNEKQVAVTLRVNGRKIDSKQVKLAAWQERDTVFMHTFDRVGDQRVELSIADDALSGDNTAYLPVRVLERVPVVIIGDSDPNQSGTATYFLTRAVAPRGGALDSYAVRYVTSQEQITAQFDDAAVVMVADSKPLGASLLQALGRYVRSGGGVVVFSDNGDVKRQLAAITKACADPSDQASADAGLPWTPTRLRDLGAQGNWLRMKDAEWGSRLLRSFDLPSQASLKQIAFRQTWQIDEVSDNTQLLVEFEDGSPAIGQTATGLGNLVVCNFSPGLEGSDLGKYGSFVALIQSMVRTLTPQTGGGQLVTPGMPITLSGITGHDPQGDAPRIVGPDGKPIPDADFSTLGNTLVASVRAAEQAGFYRVMQGDYTLALTAVNIDPLESDPRRISAEELAQRFSDGGSKAVQASAEVTGGLLELRGTPLWGWLAAGVMMLLAVEMMIVGFFRR